MAAAEEERFTRIKHGKRPVPFSAYELPFHAIHYCLREAGLHVNDLDHIAYSFDPWLLPGAQQQAEIALPLEPSAQPANGEWLSPWDPLFLSHVVNAPRHLAGGFPHHLQDRFRGGRYDGPWQWHFVPHHIAHAASAFHASPFEGAAVLTLDGRGERATTLYALGEGSDLRTIGQVDMPHSLGLLYERVTEHLGFLHSSDEYKVMALASYGEPRYRDQFLGMIKVAGGCYTIDDGPLNSRFGPARLRGSALEQHHLDIARSLQAALETTVLDLSRWLHRETAADKLAMAGGVALNCVMNARLRDQGPYNEIWVQPAAGDAGTALGAALWVDARCNGHAGQRRWTMDHAYLGPSYSDDEIERFLQWSKLPFCRMENVAEETAALLESGSIVGWFQDRMEFGPRALGARSILASPIEAEMQQRLNEIKDREDFRPVAPAVLEEDAQEWFTGARRSPFMLFVNDVRVDKAGKIPAVRHVDGTARIQTVNRSQNARYYDLLRAFKARTGVPVLINTSFNTRGEPIVQSPRDAVECFWTSPLDALVIGSFLLEKPR
jgi:carbamoyltransferase